LVFIIEEIEIEEALKTPTQLTVIRSIETITEKKIDFILTL